MPTKKKDLMDNIMSGKIDLNKYKPKAKKPKFIKDFNPFKRKKKKKPESELDRIMNGVH